MQANVSCSRYLFASFIAGMILVPTTAAQPPDLPRLVTAAPLIFRGTFVGAAETPALPPAKGKLGRVRVDETLRGANSIGDFTGQEVLIDGPAVGERRIAIYFVRPVAYGKTLVAEELAEMDVPADMRAFGGDIARAEQQNADAALRDRIMSAEAVIVGRVVDVRAVRKTPRPSEHDPDWAIAQVLVVRRLKGEPRGRDCGRGVCAEVAFAQSDDIRWFRSPKLTPQQTAIFLLRPADPKLLREGEMPPARYVLIDPQDLRPPAEENRVVSLARR